MMKNSQLSEEAIFKVAAKIESVDARTAYLEQVCGDDRALFERVLDLLRVHDEEAQFLEMPAAEFVNTLNMPITEQEGSLIGPYKLLQQIGEGGFGVVYMAEQTQPVRRKVALKIIKPGMDTKEVIARFEAERQALALMDHPNIAKVLDAGATESARPYFVMELVKGVPIVEYCDKNHLPARERLKLFVDVCRAIQHAHQKGVIHRDLKPTNIMVTLHDGQPVPKVIDFGVSKALSQQLTEKTLFTAYGQMVGTPAYMSPEQAEMSGLDIDTRSDVYSLGVLLYELLTGTTPFDGKRLRNAGYAEMQRIIREEEPPRPSTRLTSLGESSTIVSSNRGTDPKHLGQLLRGDLDWIVMKALEKDRNRRYETANGLAADVERYLNDEAVVACPPTTGYRFRKFVRRYKRQVAVAGSFTLLLFLSTVVAWLLYVDASIARNSALTARDELSSTVDNLTQTQNELNQTIETLVGTQGDLVSARDELKRRLYDYNIIKAHAARERNDFARMNALLADCVPLQRRWEWHRLQRLANRRVFRMPETQIAAIAASPVEPQIAILDSSDWALRLVDIESGRELESFHTGFRSGGMLSFSPSGKLLAAINFSQLEPATLQLWDLAHGRKIWEWTREKELVRKCDFSPDGRYLAFGSGVSNTRQGTIHLWDVKKQQFVWQQPAPVPGLPLTRFGPDGTKLYINVASGPPPAPSHLYCWNIAEPSELWSVPSITTSIPVPTSDGSLVVTGGPRHSLRVFDAANGSLVEQISGVHADSAAYLEFSPDGRHLISQGHLGHRSVWDWSSKRVVNVLPDGEVSNTIFRVPAFTSDSKRIVFATRFDTMESREITPAPAEMNLSGHERAASAVAFLPDGKQVVSTSLDATLRWWNADTGQELKTVDSDDSALDMAVSSDGRKIAIAGFDGVRLWSAETGRLVHHWAAGMFVWRIDISPGGDRVIACGRVGGNEAVLLLLDATTGATIFTRELSEEIGGLAFCTDGTRAVSVVRETGRLDLWDLQSQRRRTVLPASESQFEPDAPCLVRSPQENVFAFVNGKSVEIWDVDRNSHIRTLRSDGATPYCLCFNADGTRLFSGDRGGFVTVWNLETGEILLTFQAHDTNRNDGVNDLTISRDGRTLATAGADGVVKLWETTYPSEMIAMQRTQVRDATQAVNRRYRESPALQDVVTSLMGDHSLPKDVRRTAIEIANTRGDRPAGPLTLDAETENLTHGAVLNDLNEARRKFVSLVEAVSGSDFDAIDVNNLEECNGDWVWAAAYQILPGFTPAERDYLLESLVEQYPEAHQFLCLRGFVHGLKQEWDAAEEDFSTLIQRVPEKTGLWITYAYILSTIHIHQNHLDRYYDLTEEALLDCLEMDDPRAAELTAKTYLLLRPGDPRIDDAVRLQHSVTKALPDDNYRWFSLGAGIAEYRRENWELACEILQQTESSEFAPTGLSTAYLFQALACKRLRQHERADQLRTAAERIMSEPGFGERDWWNAFIAQVAYEEVLRLFEEFEKEGDADSQHNDADKPRAQRIVSPGSDWKWLCPGDGVNPAATDPDFHTTFFQRSYDDSHWTSGTDSPGPAGGFGYGVSTGVIFDGAPEGRSHTAWFRHRFTADRTYEDLLISLQRDDGIIVYLDGKEIGRNNMGDGEDTFELSAQQDVSHGQETWVGFYPLSGNLEPGEHVLAISLHNSRAGAGDLRIAEITLWGTPRKATR